MSYLVSLITAWQCRPSRNTTHQPAVLSLLPSSVVSPIFIETSNNKHGRHCDPLKIILILQKSGTEDLWQIVNLIHIHQYHVCDFKDAVPWHQYGVIVQGAVFVSYKTDWRYNMLAQPVGRSEDHNWTFSGSSKVLLTNWQIVVNHLVEPNFTFASQSNVQVF